MPPWLAIGTLLRVTFARRFLLLGCVVGAALAPARAQTLVGAFALNSSLNNLVSGGVSLNSLGGVVGSTGYVFGLNQGLTFTSPALTPGDFSIELSFKFDATSGWRKIVDFANRGIDSGLYNLSGALQVFPQSAAGVSDFSPGTTVDVMLTRDGASGTVSGYVNGVLRVSFNDSLSNYALVTAPNNALIFFVDDAVQGTESSSGTANYIRIFNGALSGADVAALYATGAPSAIPEPGVTAAIFGLVAIGIWVRRRRATA